MSPLNKHGQGRGLVGKTEQTMETKVKPENKRVEPKCKTATVHLKI